jgi:hypothetical protein
VTPRRRRASGLAATRVRAASHLGAADVAAALCRSHPEAGPAPLAGHACGWCRERAIRDSVRLGLDPGYDPASVPVAPRRVRGHFGPGHPLAEVAARHCRGHVARPKVGVVACWECWSLAIAADERVVVEYGLPRELTPDPDHVDDVAVRQACAGERVPLTRAERVEAVRRLYAAGLGRELVAARLRMAFGDVPPLRDMPQAPTTLGRAA